MRRASWTCLGLLLLAGRLAGAEPSARLVEEVWNAAYLEGNKAGYVHTAVHEITRNGQRFLRTTTELSLTVKRFDDVVQLRMETGSEETPEGQVTGVSMRQYIGKQQQLVVTGTVEGNVLRCRIDGGNRQAPVEKTLPWTDKVVGLYRQEHIYQQRKVKPGDSFTFLSYEPTVVAVVTRRITVKDYEEVEVLGEKKRLLRVEDATDKIQNVALPALASWLDADLLAVRSQVEMPGLGRLVLYRTTKDQALRSGPLAKVTDIGVSQLLRLNRRIARPYDTSSAVYRITLKGDDSPATAFAHDERQQIRKVNGNEIELTVKAVRGPQQREGAAAAEEFLASNYFINCNDARVRSLARQAVGSEKDPWRQVLLIEKWVHDHLDKKNFTEAFATADQVARTLEGDCTEHAMLTAAMCRAVGIPSRTAVGLLYIDMNRGPVLGFHMWTEVHVRGQWVPIDATLGKGYVGATHIKITDHSWHDIQSLTPLLPVVRVLGKLGVEVVQVNNSNEG